MKLQLVIGHCRSPNKTQFDQTNCPSNSTLGLLLLY